jgi:hypothetical protein
MSFIYIIFKNTVSTSQKSHWASSTKISRLMLFIEIIALYCESHLTKLQYVGKMQCLIMIM